MSTEPTDAGLRRRSSTLVVPEGKPAFAQPLESELLINEDEQLTYVASLLRRTSMHLATF